MWRTEGWGSGLQFPLCSFHVSHSIYYLLIFTWFPFSPLKWSIFFKMNFSSVQLLSHVQLFATLWTAACQASLSIINSRSLLKFMSIESVMPSNHLILCHPLLLPSVFPSIRVFSNESTLCMRWPKYWSFSFRLLLLFAIELYKFFTCFGY